MSMHKQTLRFEDFATGRSSEVENFDHLTSHHEMPKKHNLLHDVRPSSYAVIPVRTGFVSQDMQFLVTEMFIGAHTTCGRLSPFFIKWKGSPVLRHDVIKDIQAEFYAASLPAKYRVTPPDGSMPTSLCPPI
jgi:hypothetical protein